MPPTLLSLWTFPALLLLDILPPVDQPTTPPARLEAVSKRLQAMLTAVKDVRGALDDLYGNLSDDQQAKFNQIGQSERQS